MEAIQQAVVNGVISVLVVVIGVVATGLKQFIVAKSQELEARATEKQWKNLNVVAQVAVEAVEQLATNLELDSGAKFKKALELLEAELKKQGIEVTAEQKQMLIEAAVLNLKEVWNTIR